MEDSIISVHFLVGINHFSEFLFEQNPAYIDQFNKNNKDRIEFEPIQLELNKVVRKKSKIELINKNN